MNQSTQRLGKIPIVTIHYLLCGYTTHFSMNSSHGGGHEKKNISKTPGWACLGDLVT